MAPDFVSDFVTDGRVNQFEPATVYPMEWFPARTRRSARRSIPDHALKGWVEARALVFGVWVTRPDPFIDINTGERGVAGSGKGAGGVTD